MIKRTLSTFILWTLVFVCMRYGGATGAVWLIAAMGVLTLHEFYALLRPMGFAPFHYTGLAWGAAMLLAPRYLEPRLTAADLLALAAVLCAVRLLAERTAENRVETLGATLFGLVYVPFMLQFLARIALIASPAPSTGLILALWLIAVTKGCDTGALLTGLAIGRHKLAPAISPKKTWEGVAGGVLLSVLLGAGIAWACRPWLPGAFTPWTAAAAAVPLAVLGIIGDLVESVIKRRASIKDTGQSIPGIGGVFDLSDSLILTAPVGWCLLHLL